MLNDILNILGQDTFLSHYYPTSVMGVFNLITFLGALHVISHLIFVPIGNIYIKKFPYKEEINKPSNTINILQLNKKFSLHKMIQRFFKKVLNYESWLAYKAQFLSFLLIGLSTIFVMLLIVNLGNRLTDEELKNISEYVTTNGEKEIIPLEILEKDGERVTIKYISNNQLFEDEFDIEDIIIDKKSEKTYLERSFINFNKKEINILKDEGLEDLVDGTRLTSPSELYVGQDFIEKLIKN